MDERIALITGSTAGIGKAAALGLARRGWKVIITGRDKTRAEATVSEIKANGGQADYLLADLSSMAQVRQLADSFKQRFSRLDALVNNAALYTPTRVVTADGLESMFATNYLSAFLLTHLLLDTLKASAPASIFNVTAPATSHIPFDDLQGGMKFNALNAFGATKTANLLFTEALAKRLEGTGVVSNAYHPGIVKTSLMGNVPFPVSAFIRIVSLRAVTPEKAAEGLVELVARHANDTNGALFHNTTSIPVPAGALDVQVQERLWAESLRLAGL